MYCPNCGQENEENGIICQRCGSALKPEHTEVEIEKIENMPKGILGAALGALLGGVVIVLLYQIGLVSVWAGVILALCTLKGYELLGSKLSTKGIVISVVLMVAVTFAAYALGSGIMIAAELAEYYPDLTMFEGAQLMFEMAQVDSEVQSSIVVELVQLYLCTGLGVALYFYIQKKNKKKKENQ